MERLDKCRAGIEKFVPKVNSRKESSPVSMTRDIFRLSRKKGDGLLNTVNTEQMKILELTSLLKKKCRKAVRNSRRKFEKKIPKDWNKKNPSILMSKAKLNIKLVLDNFDVRLIMIIQT